MTLRLEAVCKTPEYLENFLKIFKPSVDATANDVTQNNSGINKKVLAHQSKKTAS